MTYRHAVYAQDSICQAMSKSPLPGADVLQFDAGMTYLFLKKIIHCNVFVSGVLKHTLWECNRIICTPTIFKDIHSKLS